MCLKEMARPLKESAPEEKAWHLIKKRFRVRTTSNLIFEASFQVFIIKIKVQRKNVYIEPWF